MSTSSTRRKSVILNSILLTAASVPCLSSPATRRNSAATEDSLEELIRATQRQGRRASEFAKSTLNPGHETRDKNIYSHEEMEQNQGTEQTTYGSTRWSNTLVEDDEDFSARAMSLTMTGLLSRLRQLLGTARDVVQDGDLQIEGGQELLDVVKKMVGGSNMQMETTQELTDWLGKGFPEDEGADKRKDRKQQPAQGWHRQQSIGWKEEENDDGEKNEENQDWENHNMSEPEDDVTLHEDGAWDDEITDQEDNAGNMDFTDPADQEVSEKTTMKEKRNIAIEGEREVENYNTIPFNPHHLGPRPVVKKSIMSNLDISSLIKALAKKPTNDGEFLRCLLDIQKYSECRQHQQKMNQMSVKTADIKTDSDQNKHYNFVRFGK